MAKDFAPLPRLPKEPTYRRAVWDYFKYFLIATPFAWVMMFLLCNYLLAPAYTLHMALVMANAIGVFVLGIGVLLSLVSPRQMTWDEHRVRQRLNIARHVFLNRDQVESDIAYLGESVDMLVNGNPNSGVKDYQIMDHAIARLRED